MKTKEIKIPKKLLYEIHDMINIRYNQANQYLESMIKGENDILILRDSCSKCGCKKHKKQLIKYDIAYNNQKRYIKYLEYTLKEIDKAIKGVRKNDKEKIL